MYFKDYMYAEYMNMSIHVFSLDLFTMRPYNYARVTMI